MHHLHLIDGSGFIYRAFYSRPALYRSDGLPVGALYGYCEMLSRLLRKNLGEGVALVSVFDARGPNWRHEMYPRYKSIRGSPPTDLVPQFPLFREASIAFGVPVVEKAGYEADDLIATYATRAAERGILVTIHSSDKDLMQLVREGSIEIFDPMKKVPIGVASVIERWGVPPTKVVDVQALAGDPTDCIPGVQGVGVKTAAAMINRWGSVEAVLDSVAFVEQKAKRRALEMFREDALLSKRLASLDTQVPDLPDIDDLAAMPVDDEDRLRFLRTFEFVSLIDP